MITVVMVEEGICKQYDDGKLLTGVRYDNDDDDGPLNVQITSAEIAMMIIPRGTNQDFNLGSNACCPG